MLIPLRLCDNLFEQVTKCFVEGFRQTICRSIVHRRLALGKLELLRQASYEAVEKWFTVVGHDVLRYAILIDSVCCDKVNDIVLFYFP